MNLIDCDSDFSLALLLNDVPFLGSIAIIPNHHYGMCKNFIKKQVSR